MVLGLITALNIFCMYGSAITCQCISCMDYSFILHDYNLYYSLLVMLPLLKL